MDNWKSVADRPSDYASLAVAIGKFDALHLGHQALLNELVEAAENHGLAPAVITFDRHPAATLTPEAAPTPIIGKSQKEHFLTEAGISAILTLEFNDELAALSPRQFVERVLVPLDTKYVVVGDDFRFGSNGSGTVATLRELGSEFGFAVKSVAKVNALRAPISTSRIRNLLDEGEVDQVAKLLGRPHLTTGVIEHGLKIGRTIGFPTANMSRDAEGYLPRDGVYAGWLYADGQRYPAAHSVGINETFQAVPRLVESHVLDRDDLDLYDKVVSLEYIDFIRPNVKFNSKEELIEAINKDLDQVRKALGICW